MIIVERCGGDDRSELEAWHPDLETAERWLLDHPPKRYDRIIFWENQEGGTLETVGYYTHEPERYYGPIVTARVSMRPPREPGSFLCVHRVPIDCYRPNPDAELNEDRLTRIVATNGGAQVNHWDCICGEWQDIEGAPEAVADLVAKYPAR